MRGILIGVFALVCTGAAAAQVETPANCHWVAARDRADAVTLWCRGPDGRARPTGQTIIQNTADYGDGCPTGLLYDGIACVSEDQAMAAGAGRAPSPSWTPVSPPQGARASVMLFADRKGRVGRGLACADQREVMICKRVSRH